MDSPQCQRLTNRPTAAVSVKPSRSRAGGDGMHVACKCNDIKNTINKRSSSQQSPLHDATADNDTYDSSLASEPASQTAVGQQDRTGRPEVGKRKSIGKLFVTARCAFWQRRRATTHEDCSCAVSNHHHQCTSSLWGQQQRLWGRRQEPVASHEARHNHRRRRERRTDGKRERIAKFTYKLSIIS